MSILPSITLSPTLVNTPITFFLRQGLTEPGVQWFDLSSWPDSFEDLPGIFPHLSNSATPSFYLGSGAPLYPG